MIMNNWIVHGYPLLKQYRNISLFRELFQYTVVWFWCLCLSVSNKERICNAKNSKICWWPKMPKIWVKKVSLLLYMSSVLGRTKEINNRKQQWHHTGRKQQSLILIKRYIQWLIRENFSVLRGNALA